MHCQQSLTIEYYFKLLLLSFAHSRDAYKTNKIDNKNTPQYFRSLDYVASTLRAQKSYSPALVTPESLHIRVTHKPVKLQEFSSRLIVHRQGQLYISDFVEFLTCNKLNTKSQNDMKMFIK